MIGRLMPSAEWRSSATRVLTASLTETSPASRSVQSRVVARHGGHGCLDRGRVVDRVLEVDVDQRGVVRGVPLRRRHTRHAGQVGGPRSAARGCPHDVAASGGTAVTGRDEHALDLAAGEVAGRDHRVGTTGLAEAVVGVGGLLGGDERASATAITTKANHAPMARHGWVALQRAARRGRRDRTLWVLMAAPRLGRSPNPSRLVVGGRRGRSASTPLWGGARPTVRGAGIGDTGAMTSAGRLRLTGYAALQVLLSVRRWCCSSSTRSRAPWS